MFARLAPTTGLADSEAQEQPIGRLFDKAFAVLEQEGRRHEHVYKAALMHRILLGKHSLQTASMLTEFRVGGCKADVVILNGTSTVYEVKSERDSLTRLGRQIEAYGSVFARVNVIAADRHVSAVMALVPGHVGVLRLSGRYQISTLRDAIDRAGETSPAAIFDAIRTAEAKAILKACGTDLPFVPNTQLRSLLREHFVKLGPHEAHDGMVAALRESRNLRSLSTLVDQLPPSLQTAALITSLGKEDYLRLVNAVKVTLADAMAWA